MKYKFIANANSSELVVFLSGWGCDDRQFEGIKTSKNLLLLWDYEDLSLNFDFKPFDKYFLICYSAGVFVSGVIKDILPHFDKKIAINGNPKLFDPKFGLSPEILKVFRSIDLSNYMDFRRNYLCYDEKDLQIFNQHSSFRSCESCNLELDALENHAKTYKYDETIFDVVILSENDCIFDPASQLEYYQNAGTKIVPVPRANHNIFFSRIYDLDLLFEDISEITNKLRQ